MHDKFGPVRNNVIKSVNTALANREDFDGEVANVATDDGNYLSVSVRRAGSEKWETMRFSNAVLRKKAEKLGTSLTSVIFGVAIGMQQDICNKEAGHEETEQR